MKALITGVTGQDLDGIRFISGRVFAKERL